KLAADYVTVVLSGDGGDELFAGYDKYLVEGRERSFRFVPARIRRLLGLLSRLMPEGMRGRNLLRHFSLPEVERCLDNVTLFRLEHKLVEFAATIPPELRLRNGTTKYIFKRALRGLLPDEIIDRPKRGFGVPLGRWFRGQLGDFVRDLLLSETSRRRGIFNTAYIEQLVHQHE